MELSYFPCWTMLKSFIPWIKVLNRLLKTAFWHKKKHPALTEFRYFQKILHFCTFFSFKILYTMLFGCILLSNAWHRFICKQIEIWLTLGVSLGYSDVFESWFDRLHPNMELWSQVTKGKSHNSIVFENNQITVSARKRSRIYSIHVSHQTWWKALWQWTSYVFFLHFFMFGKIKFFAVFRCVND